MLPSVRIYYFEFATVLHADDKGALLHSQVLVVFATNVLFLSRDSLQADLAVDPLGSVRISTLQ